MTRTTSSLKADHRGRSFVETTARGVTQLATANVCTPMSVWGGCVRGCVRACVRAYVCRCGVRVCVCEVMRLCVVCMCCSCVYK